MITMAPNSSREANAAASCEIVHNRECFRMMFAQVLSGCQGIADADGCSLHSGKHLTDYYQI
jgi:hypothetical protein